ncbi:MAG: succinylglutamate-semialdehyde dehydrogenase [Desulfomonile tiedjei]|nr:succinylglutamate-semialdehyde dehydrogenase [Desulfomonile tiedjei]
MTEKTHFIDGKWTQGAGPEFRSTDPATGEPVWTGLSAAPDDVKQAVEAAGTAFETWSARSPEERLQYLESFRENLTAQKDQMAEIICLDTGKPRWEALTEAGAMIAKVDISIQAYHDRRSTVTEELAGGLAATRFKPHGVVAVFGPFNLPGHLPNGHIVPALLAGNTVVFKPSEQAPAVALKTMELWEAAGLPHGVLNMVQGARETGIALAQHPGIEGLFFTGSADTGRALHKAFAGWPDKILALEMGGNNPLLVHEVSDLNAAAYLTVESAFITAGQRCTCARRLVVPEGTAGDSFIQRLMVVMSKIKVGSFREFPEPFMGPVISENVAEGLSLAQDAMSSDGGKVLVKMERLERPGWFLSPGLIDVTEVKNRKDAEFFGPLLQLIRVPDFDAAIREANNTAYGLAAGLLSDNKGLYDRFFRKVRAGVINWNRQTTGASGKMPFGGVGASGNHRPSGYYAADYCSYPIASMEIDSVKIPAGLPPGIEL